MFAGWLQEESLSENGVQQGDLKWDRNGDD